jgi:hypothetical protein
VTSSNTGKRQKQHPVVYGVVRPQIDIDKLVRGLLRAAEDLAREDELTS